MSSPRASLDSLAHLEPQSEDSTLHPPSPYEDSGPEPSMASTSDMHIRSRTSSTSSTSPVLPRWMRESSSKLPTRWIPLPLRQFGRFVAAWSKGPDPPKIVKIEPWAPRVQEVPLRLVERFLYNKRRRVGALVLVYAAWLLTFGLVIRASAESGYIEGYGKPTGLWCGASLWGSGNSCGMDGNNCRPFTNSSLAFRCNADCLSTELHNARAVGDQVVNYQSFVIGGSGPDHSTPIYRGDSFICQAAIHAGIVTNRGGGCGVLKLTGSSHAYASSKSHSIPSLAFDSDFPKSFTFDTSAPTSCGVVDMRWPLLAVTATFTSLISLFVSSPGVFFSSIFTMLFFHTGLVSDRPNIAALTPLFSLIIERFLPASLGAYVLYRFSVRPCLTGLTAQVEKTVLWLGAAWVGALNNYTLGWIPIQRLTPHDLRQPGAVLALVIIVLLIFSIALVQAYNLRLEGRFRKYLGVYSIFIVALLVGVALPSLNVRIHHYILALLLLPGTRVQTRASLVWQGLLVGLYVNGTARWGFASILQTTRALIGDGQTDSLLPNITAVVDGVGGMGGVGSALGGVGSFIGGLGNVTFSWGELPEGYDGLSVLVNDVERKRWYRGEGRRGFVWEGGESRRAGRREYFRFAYMDGSLSADYTKAGVWEVDGSWREAEDGHS